MKNIAIEIKEFLLVVGVPQRRLAEESGLSAATINRICRGKQRDTLESSATELRAAMSRIRAMQEEPSHAPEA